MIKPQQSSEQCALNHKCQFDGSPCAFYYAFILDIVPEFKSIEFLFISCNLLLHLSSGHIINLGEWNRSRQQHETQSSHPLLFHYLRCVYGSCFVTEDDERSGLCEGKVTIFLCLTSVFSNHWYTNVMLILKIAPLETHRAELVTGIVIDFNVDFFFWKNAPN